MRRIPSRVELASKHKTCLRAIQSLNERITHIYTLDLDPRMETHFIAECHERLVTWHMTLRRNKTKLDLLSRC